VLAEIGALDDPMVKEAGVWIGAIAAPDGGLPFVLPSAAANPHAAWMVPSDGGSFSHLRDCRAFMGGGIKRAVARPRDGMVGS